jgi:hypothetical protein
MAQPCGKVLSFDSRYRIYMRSSPLICIADAISIPLNLLILKLRLKLPWSACLTTLIHSRFGAEKEGEAWKAWKFTTPLRWFFFILGPLGPGIKMLSMDGIPWSKTWGLMFLVSFSVTELLVVLAWKINSLEGLGRTAASQTLDDNGVVLFFAALGIQVLVSIDCTFRLLSFPMPSLLSNPVARVSVILWETLCLSNAVSGIIWVTTVTWGDYWEIHLGDLLIRLGLLFVAVFAIFAAGVCSSYKSAIVDTLILYIIVAFVFLVSWSLAWLSSRASADVVKVLCITKEVTYRRRTSGDFDRKGALLLIFFLLSLVLCISWYAFRYDPTGTFNPPWTSVFG